MVDQNTNDTVLNVLGNFMQARCIPDRLSVGKPNIDYYTASHVTHESMSME